MSGQQMTAEQAVALAAQSLRSGQFAQAESIYRQLQQTTHRRIPRPSLWLPSVLPWPRLTRTRPLSWTTRQRTRQAASAPAGPACAASAVAPQRGSSRSTEPLT